MKLLIVTQKVDRNDGYFGFFHGWILEFAAACEKVTVIGLEVGAYDVPGNVKVLSLGKETKKSKIQYAWRLISYSWKERKNYDVVFVHMNPPYVLVAGWLWKILGKKVGLWYVHRNVDLKLRLAHMIVNAVFTAVPESFRIKSSKANYLGQAVLLEMYKKPQAFVSRKNPIFTIVSVGRITPIKNLDTLIRAAIILRDKGIKVHIDLVGEPVQPSDHEYKKMLVDLIAGGDIGDAVTFVGNVPNKDIPSWYWKSDLSMNLCPTGGLDKSVLESMASETPVMVSNEAFKAYYGDLWGRMSFAQADAADLAAKLSAFITSSDKEGISTHLLKEVEARSSLRSLVKKIVDILSSL